MLATAQRLAGDVLAVEFDIDDDGYVTSNHPIFPPWKEILLGTIASGLVFYVLWKKAGPLVADAMKARTQRIQDDLDSAAQARTTAEKDAAEIRTALGDVDAERSRLFAEADAQAAALLEDGRARLDQEVADLEAKADADIGAAQDRGADDLRVEIARYSSSAIEDAVTTSLDDATQQRLIEDFISRVGAQGATV